jgi:hypothetical protein
VAPFSIGPPPILLYFARLMPTPLTRPGRTVGTAPALNSGVVLTRLAVSRQVDCQCAH